jgi:UDP-glucuronate decarboxylase
VVALAEYPPAAAVDVVPHVLLTGGTGFFGRALLRYWADMQRSAVQVSVVSRRRDKFVAQYPEFVGLPWLTIQYGDILQPDRLQVGCDFTYLIHAAADSTLGPQLVPLERYDQIVTGTRNMLEFAVANGAKRFLLTSSGGVYGRQPAHMERIPEDYMGVPDPMSPASAYGLAKRSAEHLCTLYAERHGLEVVVARCFAFVGQDLPLDVHFAIGNFIRDALWADEIVVQGDGTAVRSYMDQRDLADWLMALLVHGKPGEAYNVGSDKAINIANLAHLVRDIVSPGKPVRIVGSAVGNAERSRYVPDVSKAHRDLGLMCRYGLEEAIGDAMRALKGHEGSQPLGSRG